MNQDHFDGFGTIGRRVRKKQHDIRLKELDIEEARLHRMLNRILADGEPDPVQMANIDNPKMNPTTQRSFDWPSMAK